MGDLVEPVLDSIEATGGGWPVLVLIIVIAAIVYLAVRWTDRQSTIAKELVLEQTRTNEQRMVNRKLEFQEQIERERNNTKAYEQMTERMIDAYNRNSVAMSDVTSVLRPMAETFQRIERYFELDVEKRNSRG